MTACADLQKQCRELLTKLKTNQASLRQSITSGQSSSLDNNLQLRLIDSKPEYARQKLKSIMKPNESCVVIDSGEQSRTERGISENGIKTIDSKNFVTYRKCDQSERSKLEQGERSGLAQGQSERAKWGQNESSKMVELNKEVIHNYFDARTSDSLLDGGTESFLGPATKPVTPNLERRRRIIDQNVPVDSTKLTEAEMHDLLTGSRNLNFSYSQVLDEDDTLPKLPATEGANLNQNAVVDDGQGEVGGSRNDGLEYHRTLVDRGNNRQLNNFIRDTTIKPKTILNATQPFSTSFSKQGPGISFENASASSKSNTSGASSLFRSQAPERRMLGYDWIAALIQNDVGLMDESEGYFRELREFRRCNRDECCNDFYMEGPFTLAETEPVAVEQALKESKVQPYTVNERLFTVPITENLLGLPLNPDKENRLQEEPTQEAPRFVRVSIPRSTLQMPYKVRPHRRRSFDASDSCSLNDHCLMGWNAVSPATLPTAKSIALTDAISGVNPKHATTMAEAEKAAATFHWPLLMDPRPQPDPMSNWRRQYMDTTLNFPQPNDSASFSLSSSVGSARPASSTLRQKTDDLLSSTYSMMYEMQKARNQREMERKRDAGKAAS